MDADTGIILLIVAAVVVLVVVLPIMAMAKVSSMSGRLQALQREVENLRTSLRRLQSPAETKPQQNPEQARHELLERISPPPVPEAEPLQHEPAPAIPPPPQPIPSAPPPVQTWRAPEPDRPPKPARSTQEWELLIGESFFNRIGAVAILIGVALLFSYFYGHHQITPRAMFCIGLAGGIALILGGIYFHKRGARIFAQGLFGAGLSVLYATIYSGFSIYSLIGSTLAFGMMSAVTAAAILLALRYDSIAISLLGLIGGFLTPVILKSHASSGGAGALFFYLALLDLGLLAVAIKKESWVILEPLTLLGTYLVFWPWHETTYTPSLLPSVIMFLTAIWGLFFAVDIYRITKPPSSYLDLRAGVSTLSALLFYTALYTDVNPNHHKWMGLLTLVFGLIYLITALVAFQQRNGRSTSGARYVVTSITLLALATAVQCKGFTLAPLWAVEAASLVWCSLRWKLKVVSVCSLVLLAAAAIALMSTDGAFGFDPTYTFRILLDHRFVAYVVLAISTAASGIMLRRSESEFHPWADVLDYVWIAAIFTAFTVETNDYFQRAVFLSPRSPLASNETRALTFAIVWAIYSLPLFWGAIKRTLEPFMVCGMLSLIAAAGTCAIAAVTFGTVRDFHSFTNLRVLTFVILMLVLAADRLIAQRRQDQLSWLSGVIKFLDISLVFLGFELLTTEILDHFLPTSPHAELVRYIALTIAYSAYSMLVTIHALRKRSNTLVCCALVVSATAVLTIAFGGLFEDPTRYIAPLLSIRALGFVVVIVGILLQRLLLRPRVNDADNPLPWLSSILEILDVSAVILGFELLTLEIHAYFRTGSVHAELLRNMMLAASYASYAVITTLYALRRRSNTLIGGSLLVSAAAILTVAIAGSVTDPTKSIAPLLTMRSLGFVTVSVALILQQILMRRRIHRFTWAKSLLNSIPVIISLLIFELLTLETWSYFSRGMGPGPALSVHYADNLRQMALSVVWLVYSIFLLGHGIWRRMAAIRYVAIGIFEISILKVFLYDLSFLETLYRIFSFIALGIILMATSYLYHRFKSLIVDAPEAAMNHSEDVQPAP